MAIKILSDIDVSGSFNLSASDIPSLAASKITSGTFGTARIPSLDASKITSGTFGTARIPSLAASKITSGSFADARIPNLGASKITAGTFSNDRLNEYLDKYTYQKYSNNGVYMPMVKGGLLTGGASSVTGRLRIKVPHYKAAIMQSFVIDVYEYNTDRMQSYIVSGYTYNDTNATWYNTSCIALADSDNRNLTVRFGSDETDDFQCVSIGETDTTWTYPNVVVRDYMAGHDASTSEVLAEWTVEFVTTDSATYDASHTTNQPIVHTSRLSGVVSVAGGGTGSTTASGARTNLGLGSLATLSAVGASQITDNSVGAAELNVSGNGSSGQVLASDGDGSFSWTSAGGTGTVTQVTVGSGLDVSNQTTTPYITLDLSELTDMTASVNTSQDELILLDNGAERRKLFSEIFGSNAYNSTTIPTNNNQLTNGAGYLASINNADWSGTDLSIANGGTGASSASAARTNLGLGTAATSATGDFATSAQGTKADNALPLSGGTLTGNLTIPSNLYHAGDTDTYLKFDTNRVRLVAGGTTKFDSNNTYVTTSGYNNSNWDTAFGWGNHASAGYLTAHPSISAASSVNNSNRTYIQDITLDSNGHITAITSATETVTNTNTQLSNEQVQDIVGAMFTGNTETNITATYQDADGTIDLVSTNTTYSVGDGGLTQKNFTSTLKTKLDGIATSANNYSLPAGSSSVRGGFKIGYTENGKNYPVEVSSEKMYVNVPWTDNNTTYSAFAGEEEGLVPNGSSNDATYFLNADGGWTIPPDTNTNTTYTADGNYGLTLSGTAFRLEDDRRRNSTSTDIYTGNTHDYTFYDASVGIRWYTAGAEEMRLENDGDLHVDGDVIAYSTTVSDERLKDDVETIENASEKVSKLRGVEYTWNEGSRKGQREIGVIAQEVEEVVPEIVHEKTLPFAGDKTYKTVDYEKLVALLIESNKEQQEIIAQLEERIIDLENRL